MASTADSFFKPPACNTGFHKSIPYFSNENLNFIVTGPLCVSVTMWGGDTGSDCCVTLLGMMNGKVCACVQKCQEVCYTHVMVHVKFLVEGLPGIKMGKMHPYHAFAM